MGCRLQVPNIWGLRIVEVVVAENAREVSRCVIFGSTPHPQRRKKLYPLEPYGKVYKDYIRVIMVLDRGSHLLIFPGVWDSRRTQEKSTSEGTNTTVDTFMQASQHQALEAPTPNICIPIRFYAPHHRRRPAKPPTRRS